MLIRVLIALAVINLLPLVLVPWVMLFDIVDLSVRQCNGVMMMLVISIICIGAIFLLKLSKKGHL